VRLQRPWLVLAVLLIPAAAVADDHRADRFGGLSFGRGSVLVGAHVADAITLPKLANKDLALIGDLSVHFGSSGALTRVAGLGGLRLTLARDGQPPRDEPKLLPFAVVLLGAVHTNGPDANDTAFAGGVGGGVDYLPRRGASRGAWGMRGQLDYLLKGGEDFVRLSVGVVYRFKE
jgi:hypothetical protein